MINKKSTKSVELSFVTPPGFVLNDREAFVEAGSAINLEISYVGSSQEEFHGYLAAMTKNGNTEFALISIIGVPDAETFKRLRSIPGNIVDFERCKLESWSMKEVLLINRSSLKLEVKIDLRNCS